MAVVAPPYNLRSWDGGVCPGLLEGLDSGLAYGEEFSDWCSSVAELRCSKPAWDLMR